MRSVAGASRSYCAGAVRRLSQPRRPSTSPLPGRTVSSRSTSSPGRWWRLEAARSRAVRRRVARRGRGRGTGHAARTRSGELGAGGRGGDRGRIGARVGARGDGHGGLLSLGLGTGADPSRGRSESASERRFEGSNGAFAALCREDAVTTVSYALQNCTFAGKTAAAETAVRRRRLLTYLQRFGAPCGGLFVCREAVFWRRRTSSRATAR